MKLNHSISTLTNIVLPTNHEICPGNGSNSYQKNLKIILNCFALPQGIAMSFLKSSFHMAKTCFNYYQLVEQRETKNQHSPKQRNLLCLLLLPQLPPQFVTSLQQIKIQKDLLGRGTAKHTCLSSFQSGLVWQIPVSAQPKPTHQYQI